MYKLDFNTSYNQFYICDGEHRADTGRDFWNETAYNDMMAMADGTVGVGTGSYGHIIAELFLLEEPSTETNFNKYDHVVEGSLKIQSGVLQVLDCPNSQIELIIETPPGDYRVRVYAIDLAKADFDLYDGHDSYKIEIWLAPFAERSVLKRYIWQ